MMENKIDEAKIIDYLYGELPKEEIKEVESLLKEHPELKQEMESMQATRNALGTLEDKEIIPPTFVFNKEQKSVSFFQSEAFRWVGSIAAGLSLLLISAALLNFNISNSAQGLQIGFGELTPLADEELNKENVKAWMTEVMDDYESSTDQKIAAVQTQLTSEMENQDQKNIALMTNMMKSHAAGTGQLMQQYVAQLNDENKEIIQNFFTVSTEKQKKYVKTVMADFNEFYQNQRNYDMRLIETSLSKIQNTQDVKQLEQDQLLASLYDMVKTQSK
ncbi:anti-sigma factor family protein [Reichenbachiella sp.]|uniref:anti-sigma factor family protein n=1 Tax=Reichenbachiella sp. TaxID=2184521 RepID=UPI003BB1F9C1